MDKEDLTEGIEILAFYFIFDRKIYRIDMLLFLFLLLDPIQTFYLEIA